MGFLKDGNTAYLKAYDKNPGNRETGDMDVWLNGNKFLRIWTMKILRTL